MIKQLINKDLNSLFEICSEQFKKECWPKPELESAIENYFCVGYFVDGNLSSFIIAQNLIDDYNILLIATKENEKYNGFASSLIKFLEEKCTKENIKKMWLEVRDSNKSAQSFYLKNGFNIIFNRKKYYSNGEDAIIMEKQL